MRAMRAEGFSGYKDLKLADIPKPAVSDGRVLIRITAAGVTPLEHTILSGGYPRAKAPLVLGGEGAGVVEEGGGTAFPVGSRVMFTGPYGVARRCCHLPSEVRSETQSPRWPGRKGRDMPYQRRLIMRRRNKHAPWVSMR